MNKEKGEEGEDREDRVHTLRLLPRCFPFLRCCMSTEKTHTHTNNATNTPNVWMWRKHKTRRRSDGERERRKGDRDGVICSERGKVKRSTSLKALD